MSGYPGLPFRSVDPFTFSQTPVFPAVSLSPLPPGLTGYPTGFYPSSRSYYDPLLPLSPRISSPALPVGFTRAELPYANSLLDPRNQLLRSPNYYLSPNASPLTFDQINSQKDKEVTSLAYEARYRSNSDLGSLARLSAFAPEPHYKTFVSGSDKSRHSFPLSPILDRGGKDSTKYPSFVSPRSKSEYSERTDTKSENLDKKEKPKLWKPFETDSPQKTEDKAKESEGKWQGAEKDSCKSDISNSVVKSDIQGNCVAGLGNTCTNSKKGQPARPVPHYPSCVIKGVTSEKNISFTTFQPWKNDTRVNEASEHQIVSDSFGKTVSGTVHYKPDNYNFPQEQSKSKSGPRRSYIGCENKLPDQLANDVKHDTEAVSTDLSSATPGNVAVSIACSGVANSVNIEGLIEKESENPSVTEHQNNNQLTSNDTDSVDFVAVEYTNSNNVPKTDSEVLNLTESEEKISCNISDSGRANHDTTGEDADVNEKSENHIDIETEVNNEKKKKIVDIVINDIKDHNEILDDLDDDKIKTKSVGKQRRISEVCASLLSLSHVTDNINSAEFAKSTDCVPVDNHSAINKSSSSELSKRKRRNSSLDKHTEQTERVPNTRTSKDPGYRTDYNSNQIGFEEQMTAMSGSCVQGYNNQVSCQSGGMRHPYNYNDNAVSYPPNMAGRNTGNQSFPEGLAHDNAKTLPNQDAKQSINDFKMIKQSKALTNVPQEQPQSDSFNPRLGNQNEYKGSPHDNNSKCSPARMSSSSSGTGPLSYGIFDTDSNTDSNFATSLSNAETNSTDLEQNVEVHNEPPFEWDYLHSKQFVDVIYRNQGCEFSGVVKSDLETLRESDSPKTFLDLDSVTKPKPKGNASKSQGLCKSLDSMYSGMSDNQNYHRKQTSSPYYNQNTKGNSYNSQWGPQRANQNEYISGDTGNGGGKGDGSNSNQGNQNYGSDYQKYSQTSQSNGVSQYDSSKGYQSQYNSQSSSGSSYYHQHSQSGYHGNSYNESNQYYDQNQNSGQSYSSGQGYSNSYQNMNQQYGSSGYRGHGSGQNYQPNSHSPGSNQSYLPSNVESPDIDIPVTPKKEYKKRGRKRKADKEQELNEQALNRPNTIVVLLPNVGPLIHTQNPTDSVDSYDYLNNPVETIFDYTYDESLPPLANQLLQIEQELCQRLMPLKYGYPVNVIYNPLVYAFQTHRDFVTKYCTSQRPILFLGMNPGPYGMSQNGVPFGEVTVVKDWLKVVGAIFKPESEHPKKPVTGLTCTRIEVSGARFWGLFQRICKVPENFFKNCFVANFCPQAYLSESGKNITPPQLGPAEVEPINKYCDASLVELVRLMNTRIIIAVGKYVQTRASKALHNAGIRNVTVECILHPSPINPHANKGWEQIVAKQLIEIGVMQYLNEDREDVQRCIEDWERAAMAAASAKMPEIHE